MKAERRYTNGRASHLLASQVMAASNLLGHPQDEEAHSSTLVSLRNSPALLRYALPDSQSDDMYENVKLRCFKRPKHSLC